MYAIGTFARDGEPPFPGLVLDDERVVDLSGYGWQRHQPDPEWLARSPSGDRRHRPTALAMSLSRS